MKKSRSTRTWPLGRPRFVARGTRRPSCDQVVTTHHKAAGSRMVFGHAWDYQSHAHNGGRNEP